MQIKKLIWLAVALLWIVPAASAVASENAVPAEGGELKSASIDTPQWKDIGMCDVLAVVGCSSLTAPSPVRLPHNTPSSAVASSSERHIAHNLRVAAQHAVPNRVTHGGIYTLRCLRL